MNQVRSATGNRGRGRGGRRASETSSIAGRQNVREIALSPGSAAGYQERFRPPGVTEECDLLRPSPAQFNIGRAHQLANQTASTRSLSNGATTNGPAIHYLDPISRVDGILTALAGNTDEPTMHPSGVMEENSPSLAADGLDPFNQHGGFATYDVCHPASNDTNNDPPSECVSFMELFKDATASTPWESQPGAHSDDDAIPPSWKHSHDIEDLA